MFSIVYIPNAVYKELIENQNYSKEAELIKDCDIIKVIKIEKKNLIKRRYKRMYRAIKKE